MSEQLSEEEKKILKDNLIDSIASIAVLSKETIKSMPQELRPYAHINPYDSDAEEEAELISKVIKEGKEESIAEWKKKLIDQGLVDKDGKTVIANSLLTVAAAIRDNEGIIIQKYHLQQFISAKTRKKYSQSQIRKVLEIVNI